ncbi:MAG: metallophosphoesterase [Chitinophagaceae bacterium]|nr:metallophosphoesterase [Oligoflexus sp.]
MKKAKYPLIFLVLVILGLCTWRHKAASYNGQNLHLTQDTGEDFELLMIGDMGSGDPNQLAVATAMNTYCESHKLAAVIFLGDNFYPKGVDSVDDPQWKSKFTDTYGQSCLGALPFYVLLGNHDYKGSTEAQIAFHGTKPTWIMPHRFFDIKMGKLLNLTMLDTNIMDACGSITNCTIDFLMDSLKNSDAPYKIVLGHHPITSASTKYSTTMQGTLLENLICDKANIYISGHSHHLEHLSSESCPLDMFVVGGGGADLYEVKTNLPRNTHFAESSFGFLAVHVNQKALSFAFYDPDLKRLYEVDKPNSKDPSRSTHD